MTYPAVELQSAQVEVLDCEHKTPSAQPCGHPYIAIPDIQHGRIDLSAARRISDADLVTWTRRTTPREGDVIVTRRGRVGDSAQIPGGMKCAIGQNLVLLRSNGGDVDQAYLRWAVRSPQWWSEVERLLNVGAVFSSLNVRDIARIRIPLPRLAEQQAIAEVLGALDDKIAANTKLADTSQSFAVTQLSVEAPSAPLREIASHHKTSISPESMKIERVAHFSLPAFDLGNGPEIVRPGEIKSSKFVVSRPSVLLSKLNPRFPRVWNVGHLPIEPALASTEFLVLEPVYSSTAVLWAILSQKKFGSLLESKVAGTSGSHQRVKPGQVLATPVIDPRLLADSKQDEITSLLDSAALLREENRTLAAMRDALLPQLMSGKLRVRDAEKIVEEVV